MRTDGTRQGNTLYQQQEQSVQTIQAPLLDHEANDVAQAITESLPRDGQAAMTGALPMGTNRIIGLGDGQQNQDAATYKQLLALTTPLVLPSGVGGTADAITLAPEPAIAAYGLGRGARFFARGPNTQDVTLSISGLPAIPLRRSNGAALAEGDIVLNQHIWCVYDGNVFRSDIHAPPVAQSTLTAAQIVALLEGLTGDNRLDAAQALRNIPPEAWAAITGKPAQFPPAPHNHSASDITAGTLNRLRLPLILAALGEIATPTPAATKRYAIQVTAAGGVSLVSPFDELQDVDRALRNTNFTAVSSTILLTTDKPKIRIRSDKTNQFRAHWVNTGNAGISLASEYFSGSAADEAMDKTSTALSAGLYVCLMSPITYQPTRLRLTAVA